MTDPQLGSFQDLDLENFYSCTGQTILDKFVYPVLACSVAYDRLTGYFSVESLVAAAAGLESLFRNGGKMRLVVGMHDVPEDLIAALAIGRMMPEDLVLQYKRRVLEEIGFLVDQASRSAISAIGWMMRSGHLEVRVAAPRGPRGIYHQKRMIFRDAFGNVIAGTGSLNETRGGQENVEEMNFHFSWSSPSDATRIFCEDFEGIWGGRALDVEIFALDETFATNLLREVQSDRHPYVEPRPSGDSTPRILLESARKAPVFGPFNITNAAFYPHQERVYLEALSRWPIRVLLGDEVGLGKTLEAGAVIGYMHKYGGVNEISILAPAGLLRQWQEEMHRHFNLDFWRWNSAAREFVSPTGETRSGPFLGGSRGSRPKMCLISSHWALRHPQEFVKSSPTMVVVDEAHSARLRREEDGFRHTKMWNLLDQVSGLVPHLVLVTATPMQMHPVEYFGLLQLLGLTEEWSDFDSYERSLQLISEVPVRPTLQEATDLGNLITSTVHSNEWLPEHVTAEEILLLEELDIAAEVSKLRKALKVQGRYSEYRRILMKVHPAHFLTWRNTKSGLERFGYRFPTRVFSAPVVVMTGLLSAYESAVETYLSTAYGEVERSLHPEGRSTVGFAKSGYYQRMVSSLFASLTTLTRRKQKIEGISSALQAGDLSKVNQLLEASDIDEEDPSLEDDLDDARLEEILLEEAQRVVGRVVAAVQMEVTYINDLLRILDSLENGVVESDPKFKVAMTMLRESVATRNVLVFSRYTDTLAGFLQLFEESELADELAGYALYTGGVVWIKDALGMRDATKAEVKRALGSGSVNVVFCSDAASEGLNLQAAQQIINLDVPWNPARLEQRIGRIARLGQTANEVHIANLWYPNSIEARMYGRLLARRDLYQLAVGEFPEIFSSAIASEVSTVLNASGQAHDPIAELQSMRSDHQRLALEAVWGQLGEEGYPPSQEFRNSLAAVVADALPERAVGLPSTLPGSEDALTLLDRTLDEVCSVGSHPLSGDDVELLAYFQGEYCLGFAVTFPSGRTGLVRNESWPTLFGAALGLRQLTEDDVILRSSSDGDLALDDFLTAARWYPSHQESRTVFDRESPSPPFSDNDVLVSRSIGRVMAKLDT